jgi:glycosyltransferase involved in cell wall biosynthesis
MHKEKILFLIRLPPPMHGAAKMNFLYLNSKVINYQYDIKYIKLNNYSSLQRNIFSIFLQLFGFLKIIAILFFNLLFFDYKLIYFEIAPKGSAFIRDSIYIWICKLFNKKIICQFHAKGISQEIKTKWKLKYYKKVFKNVTIILLSKMLYYDVKSIIPEKNIFYLPNGIEDEITDREFKDILKIRLQNKELVLLYLSNMIESKGPLDVLEICRLLKKEKVNFKCYFAGAWDSESFKIKWFSLVKKYNLNNECIYVGPKYGLEKNKLLFKTNYLIFPTQYPMECYPLVILEAFMFGVPVLAYNNGAIGDIINSKELGFVALNNKYTEIYDYIIKDRYKSKNYLLIRNKFKKDFMFNRSEHKLKSIFITVIK